MRDRSDHDPTRQNRQSATRLASEVTFRAPHEHFDFVMENTTFRAPAIIPNCTKCYTCHENCDTWTSLNTAPTTKSDTWTSPNSAPATKSDTWTSPNIAPAMKSDTSTSRPYESLRYSSLLFATLYSTLLYSSLLYSTLLFATLLYSTLLCSTLLYSTLFYSTLLYSTLTNLFSDESILLRI